MRTTTLGVLLILVRVGAYPTPVPSKEPLAQSNNGHRFFPNTYYHGQNHQQQPQPQLEGADDQANTNSVYYGYVLPPGSHYHYHYPHLVSNRHNPPGGSANPYVEYYGNKHLGPEYDYNGDHDDETDSEVQYDGDSDAILTDIVHGVNNERSTLETKDDEDVPWRSYFGIDDKFPEAPINEHAIEHLSNRFWKANKNEQVSEFHDVEMKNKFYRKKQENNQYIENITTQTTTKSTPIPTRPSCIFVGQVMCNRTNACHYRECVPGIYGLYAVHRKCALGLATGPEVCQRLDELSRGGGKINERLYVNPCTHRTRKCSATTTVVVPTKASKTSPSLTTIKVSSQYSTHSPYITRSETQRPFPPSRATWATFLPDIQTQSPHSIPIDISPSESVKPTTRLSTPSSTVRKTEEPTPIPTDGQSVHTQPSHAVSRETSHPRQTDHVSHFEMDSMEVTTRKRVVEPLISTTKQTASFIPTGNSQPATLWYLQHLKDDDLDQRKQSATTTNKASHRAATPQVVDALAEPTDHPIPWYHNNFHGLLDAYNSQHSHTSSHLDDHFGNYSYVGNLVDHPSGHSDEAESDDSAHEVVPEADTDAHASPYVVESYDPLSTKVRPAVQPTALLPIVDTQNDHQVQALGSPASTEEPFEYANINEEYEISDDEQVYMSYGVYYPDYYYNYY